MLISKAAGSHARRTWALLARRGREDGVSDKTHPARRLTQRGAFYETVVFSAQQLWQLGEVRRHAPRLVALQPSRRKVAISG